MAQVEYPLIRAPYEAIHQVSRNTQKIAVKDITEFVNTVKQLKLSLKKQKKDSCLVIVQTLKHLQENLKKLKRKLKESSESCEKHIKRCRIRLDHLSAIESLSKPDQKKQMQNGTVAKKNANKYE